MSRNNEEVERFLENNLERVTEADPKTLIPYILALIHKPKEYCIEQLRDFLHEETESFVNKLFDFLSTLPKFKKSKEHRHEKENADKDKDKDKDKKRKHHRHHHDEDSKRRKKEGKLKDEKKDERKHGEYYQGEDSITLVGGSELSNVVDSHQQNTIPVARRLPVGMSYPYIQHPQANIIQPQAQQTQQVLAAPSVFQPQIIRTIPMVSGSTPQPILVMHNGQPTYILPAPLPQTQTNTQPQTATQVQSQPQPQSTQSTEITGHEGHRNTVLVKNIPLECNNIAKLSAHFERFGVVLNIRVHHASKTALVTFQNGYEAQAAINAPEAVCGNRFISTQWAPLEKRQLNRQYHKSEPKSVKHDNDAVGQSIKSPPTDNPQQNQQEIEKQKLREERFRKEKEVEAEKLKLLESKRAEAMEKMKSLQANKEQSNNALQQLLDKKRATVEAALEKVKKRFAELEQNPSLATPEEKTHLMKQIKELGFALRNVALQKQNVISFT